MGKPKQEWRLSRLSHPLMIHQQTFALPYGRGRQVETQMIVPQHIQKGQAAESIREVSDLSSPEKVQLPARVRIIASAD
jgi:hypothetical protein